MNYPFKQHLKKGFQKVAARFGPLTRPGTNPRLLILMYHRILPLEDGRCNYEEPGMTVSPETFSRHLDLVKHNFEIIRLAEWVSRRNNGLPLPNRACAITFDDGWLDNYEYAFPILRDSSIPATLFVVTDMIGTNDMFWPERLSRVVHAIHDNAAIDLNQIASPWLRELLHHSRMSKLDREHIATLIAQAKFYTDQHINHAIDHAETILGGGIQTHPPSLMNWDQVNEMASSGIITIGSHTRHHIRLNEHTPWHVMQEEIIGSKKALENILGRRIDSFCFPNGDITDSAYSLVKLHYDLAVSTKSGWNSLDSDVHMLQRIGIHEDATDSDTSFLARISGWM